MEEDTAGRAGILPLDTTVLSLVAVNAVTIVLALAEGWGFGTVIFIYWFQSVIIGVFTVLKLLTLDGNPFASLFPAPAPSGGQETPFTGSGLVARLFIAGFFAVHYGIFHFGYYAFIEGFGFAGSLSPWTNPDVLIACGLFFANHLYSFLHYRMRERGPVTEDTVKEIFVAPYARIVPMHVTIMAAGFASILFAVAGFDAGPVLLVLFLGLKTYVDVRMHLAKHEAGVE